MSLVLGGFVQEKDHDAQCFFTNTFKEIYYKGH